MSTVQPVSVQPLQVQVPSTLAEAGGHVAASAPRGTGTSNPVAQRSVAASQPKQQTTAEDIKNAATKLQNHVQQVAPELLFSVDEGSGRSIITITDPATNKVIQQIPSEEALRMTKEIDQFQKHQGLLVDRKG